MGLPGSELVEQGLADLKAGRVSAEALLVACARRRLEDIGMEVPPSPTADPWHDLFRLLAADDPDGAAGRHAALVRRLVSFARAAEHARAA